MSATAQRPVWSAVPGRVRKYVEVRLGEVVVANISCGSGYTPGLASRLVLADGRRVFVKGVPGDHPLADMYATESAITERLPEGAPTPVFLWSAKPEESGGWFLLCLEDIRGAPPDLSPGSPDVPAVIDAVATMARALTPPPIEEAPQASVALGPMLHGWACLKEDPPSDLDPWVLRHLNRLADSETAWLAACDGNTLLHCDLRPDNMITRVEDRSVVVLDWSYLHQGAPWVEAAALVPHMIMAGHTPAQAEQVVSRLPGYEQVPFAILTSFAVALAGYWERSARQEAPPGAPHLREFQARAAVAGRAWVAHRTGWV